MALSTPLQDMEEAEHAYERVRPEMETLSVADLSPMSVDVVSATSIALGVSDRILSFRDRMAALPEFDMRNVDNLVDYAKAAWYAYVTNLPEPDPHEAARLLEEVKALRAKLLMWAVPLVGSGFFEEVAIAKIKEGSGNKDAPSDLVALVGLYRSRWDAIRHICGVTEADLTRGAQIGPAVFGLISRREFKASPSLSDGSLRVRRAWTLLDRAYAQCRRAIAYFRFDEGDVDVIAPNLRRNPGRPTNTSAKEEESPPESEPRSAPTAPEPPPAAAGAVIHAGEPFLGEP